MGHSAVTNRCDFLIIGGGIVGAACAEALARDGRRVVVVERDLVGGGATAAGMGHVVVMDDSPAQLALTSYARQLWQELAATLPAAAECERCGTIWVAADEQEMAVVEHKGQQLAARDVASQVLSANELKQLEPQLRSGLAGGLLVPDDLVVYPPAVARLLMQRAEQRGAELRSGVAVRQVDQEGTVTLSDGSALVARRVLIAAGCWSTQLEPSLPIKPRKGHLVITDRYSGLVRHQLIELGYLKSAHTMQTRSVAFNVQPRRTGQLLIGSSRQFDAQDDQVELAIVGQMMCRAQQYLPVLSQLTTLRVWTGHRAATPDKLPLIGPRRTTDRIWYATGHEGLGIATSLATAQLIADQLAGRDPAIPAAPYLPDRFTTAKVSHE